MEFNIVETLLGMTLVGAEWVLWLLLILSVVSVAVIIERALYFYRTRIDFAVLSRELNDSIEEDKTKELLDKYQASPAIEAQVAVEGLSHESIDASTMEGRLEGFLVGQKSAIDRGLVILGTLGNNAPFIGLFGTVIGIIQAFHDLAQNPDGGPSVVMAGISEALVATAVGLMVAIPAVIAYNAFNRLVKRRLSNAQSIIKLLSHYQGGHSA